MSKTRRLFWFFSVCLKQQFCFLSFFFFKVFTGFVTIASVSWFGFWPWGTWDQGLNSQPCIGRTARESRVSSSLNLHLTYLPESQRSAFSRRPQTCGHGQGGPSEDRSPDAGALTQTRPCVEQTASGKLLFDMVVQFRLCADLEGGPGWEAGSRGNRYTCTDGGVMLLSSRSWHNVVKQLYSNNKIVKNDLPSSYFQVCPSN